MKGGRRLTMMINSKMIISLTAFVGIMAIALGLIWWNMQLFDEYKSTFTDDFMLSVYALPTFEALENKKFNE